MRTQKILLFAALFLFSLTAMAEKNIDWVPPKKTLKSASGMAAGCVPATTSTELELNNVRALVHTGGDMWWDLQGLARYEVPKDSRKTALFAGSIWIGGTDVNGQLKLAAVQFRSGGVDYWPGPLITSGPNRGTTTSDVCLAYDKHYKINRNQVAEFRAWFNADPETRAQDYPGYVIPNSILNWPAHGDVAAGYDYYLAPFKDVDGDGFYDPYAGDYPFYDIDQELPCGTSREQRIPRLFGDETLWWVYNDRGNVHTETNGDAIGMEIRAQAFAFSTNDELNDMTFYNYALINRSTYTLIDTYFGVWTDADMGYAFDDYVGCDVNRGLGYLYNGTAIDGTGQFNAYGGPSPPPPAVGVDFFEGPYQDADGLDNPSSWVGDELICDGNIMNGNINGLNFGDGIIDNERWGMRRFIFYNNVAGPMGNPTDAFQYYNYLRGIWLDGSPMLYGGTGHPSDASTGTVQTDFMFPSATDPCGWGQQGVVMPSWDETTEDNPPNDRRFIQSAGPFTLEPGAVNDITVGVVWARAQGGTPYTSVEEVKVADDKAQLLFDNCFKVVDGPDSPELTVIELDRQLVFHIFNLPSSNNFMEGYIEKDFTIVDVDVDGDGEVDEVDKFYRFEGYQVYQLKDATVSVSDIGDAEKARQVFQCDVKNGVTQLVNFTWNPDISANVPEEMVNGVDEGIQHTFTLTEDAFAQRNRTLVNHKRYYYLIIAYGYNQFKPYDQNDINNYNGQKLPYKAGRKSALGSIKTYEAIPHVPEPGDGGTIANAVYGQGVAVTQKEGFGSGTSIIDLSPESKAQIMAGEPWRIDQRTYEPGRSPITLKVVDPLNIPEGRFALKFHPDSSVYNTGGYKDFRLNESRWYIYPLEGEIEFDTIWSDASINVVNEQVIAELGLSVSVEQKNFLFLPSVDDKDDPINADLEYEITYPDPNQPWLTFVTDGDDFNAFNWIRSGTQSSEDDAEKVYNDYPIGSNLFDKAEVFESFANGHWAPYLVASHHEYGPAKSGTQIPLNYWYFYRMPNVDLVLTSDKSMWTRSPVLETAENDSIDTDGDGVADDVVPALFGQGDAKKFELRDSPSINKDGTFASSNDPSENPDDPNYISARGMGWFPGYAIDVETGRRLNIVYGEASDLPAENGRDMKWNPTSNYFTTFGDILFGGKHFIYIVGNNFFLRPNGVDTSVYMPAYDAGKYFMGLMRNELNLGVTVDQPRTAFQNIAWTSIPMLTGLEMNRSVEDFLQDGDISIQLRMTSPMRAGYGDFTVMNPENDNFPSFEFDTYDIKTDRESMETAVAALDLINVVPNPYYGYSEYETNQLDNLIKVTNLPNQCTITIYNSNGTLIRQFRKDNSLSYQEWDLKNQYGIPIASGLYIIHVDAYEVGEKVIKWFGAMRPIDLNAF